MLLACGLIAVAAIVVASPSAAVASCGTVSGLAGSGTGADPYQVATRADLEQMDDTVANMACDWTLVADIDLGGSGSPWATLGRTLSPVTSLTGTFDGNGRTISNLYVNNPGTDGMALFRGIKSGGSVRNLRMTGMSVTGRDNVGAVAGRLDSLSGDSAISGVSAYGSVSGRYSVGGLAGLASVTASGTFVKRSASHVDVSGSLNVGGLLGEIDQGNAIAAYANAIDDSYASGSVTAGTTGAGGLVGYLTGTSNSQRTFSLTHDYNAAGTITSAQFKGAFVAWDDRTNRQSPFDTSAWNGDLTGVTAAVGVSNLPSYSGPAATSLINMHQVGTYVSLGFGIDSGWLPASARGSHVWGMCKLVNDGTAQYPGTPFLYAEYDPLDPCLAPATGLTATPGDGMASIAFAGPDERTLPIANYEYSTDDGTTWTALNPADASSPLEIPSLTNGTTYEVLLRPVGAQGAADVGEASSAVSVTPVASPAPPAPGQSSASSPDTPAGGGVGRLPLASRPQAVRLNAAVGAGPTDIRTRVVAPGPGTIRQQASTPRTGPHATQAAATGWSVCSDTTTVRAAGTVTVDCPLSARARAVLQQRSLRTTVVTTFIGADGARARSVLAITLDRVPRRAPRTAVAG